MAVLSIRGIQGGPRSDGDLVMRYVAGELGRVNLDRRTGRLLVSFGTTLTRLEATARPEGSRSSACRILR
jgi:hypothetical protein